MLLKKSEPMTAWKATAGSREETGNF
jgi:hypothetical protein